MGATPTTNSNLPSNGLHKINPVPVKDALSLHEYYTYSDGPRSIRATVYDTMVLPFYFWWWIDYNRFVQSTPAAGNSYVVVFVRVENIGDQSAIIPSGDQFNLTYKGMSYSRLPYFNTSVLSSWQANYYLTHFNTLPYQWIREIGQDKRDYGFLTEYINYNWTSDNSTSSSSSSTNSSSSFQLGYQGYFLKPGESNAIDGYLIYEVPTPVANDLSNAYLQVSFNSMTGTRWKLANPQS